MCIGGFYLVWYFVESGSVPFRVCDVDDFDLVSRRSAIAVLGNCWRRDAEHATRRHAATGGDNAQANTGRTPFDERAVAAGISWFHATTLGTNHGL